MQNVQCKTQNEECERLRSIISHCAFGILHFAFLACSVGLHMLNRFKWIAVVTVTATASLGVQARAAEVSDRLRMAHGSEVGEVTGMTPLEVTLDKGTAGTRTVAVNEIKSIVFDDEPSGLTQARVSARNGSYKVALEALGQIDLESVRRDLVRQDVEFFKAYCAGRLALGGSGEILEAGRQLNSFVRAYPDNYHYLEAAEAMGDLLMATGKYASAEKQYSELAKAPWPEYKMRASVLIARTLQAQNKHAEAIAEFDKVLDTPGQTDDVQSQKLSATLGKAVSLAATDRGDEAVNMIETVIRDADPEQKELLARAYNALGSCYEQAGKTKDALLAFLHVDLLYNTFPDAHAEALSHLVPLWRAVGHDESAREARKMLSERYSGSRWSRSTQ
jgi:tetratricopeptide (TPR) repeat protein